MLCPLHGAVVKFTNDFVRVLLSEYDLLDLHSNNEEGKRSAPALPSYPQLALTKYEQHNCARIRQRVYVAVGNSKVLYRSRL